MIFKTAASTLVEIRNKGFNSIEELERGISRISIEKNELKREFDKLSLEQKRIKEVVKHIQICISKREHYEGYRKNPNDRIYMMMSRKDVEAYQKAYEEIDIFLKQFPHLRHMVLGELKTKSGKIFLENQMSIQKICRLNKRKLQRNIMRYQ